MSTAVILGRSGAQAASAAPAGDYLTCAVGMITRDLTSFVIPDGITKIGKAAFAYCDQLTSITIPSTVTEIEEEAFRGCTALTAISIPSSVTAIRRSVLQGCTGLTEIKVLGSPTSIEEYAFADCPNCKKFDLSACTTLPALASANAFAGCKNTCDIIVSEDCYMATFDDATWSELLGNLTY